jgi:hypothetical protein
MVPIELDEIDYVGDSKIRGDSIAVGVKGVSYKDTRISKLPKASRAAYSNISVMKSVLVI